MDIIKEIIKESVFLQDRYMVCISFFTVRGNAIGQSGEKSQIKSIAGESCQVL